MNNKPNILFVTPILGHPPKGGPELRIENSIKALAKVSDLTLYCRVPLSQMGGDTAVQYLRHFAKSIYFAPFCTTQHTTIFSMIPRAINLISRTIAGRDILLPASSLKIEGQSDYLDVIEKAELIGADVIWLGFGNISYPLLKYIKENSRIPVVVDTDSVWSRFLLRGTPYAKDDSEREQIEADGKAKEEEECWGTNLADVTTGVSEIDAEYYRNLSKDPTRVHLFSNVIDLSFYAHTDKPLNFKTPSIYLAGTFWPGSPMEDAARWMRREILPLVKREIQDIHFYIAGRSSETILADINDDNVTITGELPSVLPYLTNATVSVVPLRFESGTRFKILEAGACAIPVVSTTLGAEGIPAIDGKDILIADTPEDFANLIVKVINNPQMADHLGSNLRKLVTKHFSIDALATEGQNIIDFLQRRRA